MKLHLHLITLLAGLLVWGLPISTTYADDSDSTAQVSKKKKKSKKDKKKDAEGDEAPAAESVVGAKLKGNTFFNNTNPNLNAEYFIFLKSASWCGPCNMEMPNVAKAYEQMKQSGKVELILLSHDQTEDKAQAFLNKYNATFAGLMKGASIPTLPPSNGIPNATIMKADGTVIQSGHGSIIQGWKEKTIGKYAIIGDDGEPRVGKAVKKMKFTNGKPSTKADFYIYLYAPDLESAPDSAISQLAGSQKDLKKAKVEVIFIADAKTPAHISKYLRSKKVKFPGIQKSDDAVAELPGIGDLGATPQFWMVTQSGAAALSGGAELASEWQEVVKANQ